MKILLFGGTGFIGRHLVAHLSQNGYNVVIASRNKEHLEELLSEFEPYGIINLAGESIQKSRWTEKQKEAILTSRITVTRRIVEAIEKVTHKPEVFINASAVGYYGTSETRVYTEESPSGDDFLASVCVAWEQVAMEASAYTRVVITRLGVVLGKDGGALPKMMLPYRFFAGGMVGSGKQWVPWVHIDDVTGLMRFILEKPLLSGPINVTAPSPLRMKEFSKILSSTLKRPNLAPVPSFVLRLLLGEMASLLLLGQRVTPKKAVDHGYRFRFPLLEEALKDLTGS